MTPERFRELTEELVNKLCHECKTIHIYRDYTTYEQTGTFSVTVEFDNPCVQPDIVHNEDNLV